MNECRQTNNGWSLLNARSPRTLTVVHLCSVGRSAWSNSRNGNSCQICYGNYTPLVQAVLDHRDLEHAFLEAYLFKLWLR